MIKSIRKVLKKRKAKVFFFFLGCSAAIWFINSLNQEYVGTSDFDLQYVNFPDGYLFKEATKREMEVKLRAGGFTFLGFNFKRKKVKIDVSEAEMIGDRFFVPEKMYRSQIIKQLSSSMTLLEIEQDTLFLDLLAVSTKKVPVRPTTDIDVAQNHLLEGKIRVAPDSITLTGPEKEIDTIRGVRTQKITLSALRSDFSEEAKLMKSPKLKNTSYSVNAVIISGKVFRFSEKTLKLPITVVNLPDGLEIKTFPDEVSVLCKAKPGRLRTLKASDFQVVGDYETTKGGTSEKLAIALTKWPKDLQSARLEPNEVEYIVKKQ
ncbi:MAG TPA: CdaR family protein [Pricia sp.]|nr:CdaR family protein [Pricia sp.]